MKRRQFLQTTGVSALLARGALAQGARPKAPFHVLFSNDTTNILSCTSPYHRAREPFRPEMLEATVDETAGTGVEVHMLQPAHGWVPWWPSTVYPLAEHHRWWREYFGVDVRNTVHDYIMGGGDLFDVFIKRCRARGQAPFISLRLNDKHHLTYIDTPKNTQGPHAICRFYAEHPEYRLDPKRGPQDWAIPEVRAYKLSLIREICENYDIDGFELDFMRYPEFFRLDETTRGQRVEIMTGFITEVRELLDRTARDGGRRWLCARIPCYLADCDNIGIDLPSAVRAGVDMLDLSASYFTEQNTDLAKMRALVPEAAVYLEMTHCTATGTRLTEGGGDNFIFRRATDEQFYTTAHLAYSRGADGVSAFNFVYYREHGSEGRGPFNEPPFHVFEHLGDPDWLARQPQHFFISDRSFFGQRVLPKRLEPGKSVALTLDMAPPAVGWKTDGRLRIQTREPMGEGRLTAKLNGTALDPNPDISEPYANPYPPMLGTPESLRAWTVPPDVPQDGPNGIEVAMIEGEPIDIVFVDLAIR
jgi:hypothetical protein